MKIKLFALPLIAFLAFSLVACVSSTPAEKPEEPEEKVAEAQPEPAKPTEEDLEYERSVGTSEVSKETFNADKAAILKKIEELNVIMNKKDFTAWTRYIDNDSKNYWSQTANLTKYSKKLPKEAKIIKLVTLQDYFNYVFIPSRKGRQIDEIRYNSADSIKAVQLRQAEDGSTEALVFYNFVKVNDDWKVYLPRL